MDRRIDELAGEMKRKTDQIRAAWAAGDQIGALRIAARFFDRSTKIFKRGMDAYNNPDFYLQVGKDPEQLIAAALELLATAYEKGHPTDISCVCTEPRVSDTLDLGGGFDVQGGLASVVIWD